MRAVVLRETALIESKPLKIEENPPFLNLAMDKYL